jgi:hypothetical protein
MATDFSRPHRRPQYSALKRLLAIGAVATVGALIFVFALWHTFFVYVPPGNYLVVVSKEGAELPPGEVLAELGQKGIQKKVQGEGWHFVMPFLYTSEVKKNTVVPAGQVGILISRGGKPLPPDMVLAEPETDASGVERVVYQGIQRQVLMPGSYRINRDGFDVELKDMVEIKPGYVGVRRRVRGKDGKDRFAQHPDEKGILREVLQPGKYAINPYEFEIVPMEVGIYQTTFHYSEDPHQNTALSFTAQGGFTISMDCTIEWEVLPQDQPDLLLDYPNLQAVEKKVIQIQAESIGITKGNEYGVQDLLEGNRREKFQEDFTQELVKKCSEKKVTVHSAFIRNIVIPEKYLEPIRGKQIAAETVLTNQAKEETAKSAADLEREKRLVDQKVAEYKAETERTVAGIDRQVLNVQSKTGAEIEKMTADYQSRIATLEAEQSRILGEAQAEVTKLKETAKASLYQSKMEIFQNDGNAFLRYSLAEKLNPNVSIRLVHAGPGTFWTNMDSKGLQFQIPALTPAPAKQISPVPAK